VISRSIYNLKIDTIYKYDIPFDRSFLQLSNGIRHVMPSTDRKLELTAKSSMAQPVSQPALYCNGLSYMGHMTAPSLSETTECVVLGRCKSEETVAYLQQCTDMYIDELRRKLKPQAT